MFVLRPLLGVVFFLVAVFVVIVALLLIPLAQLFVFVTVVGLARATL